MDSHKNKDKIPWYLSNNWSLFFLAVTPPIGYLMIILNLHKMDKETKSDRLFWGTLFAALWSLGFLPKNNIYSFITIFLFFSFSTVLLFIKLLGYKNK